MPDTIEHSPQYSLARALEAKERGDGQRAWLHTFFLLHHLKEAELIRFDPEDLSWLCRWPR